MADSLPPCGIYRTTSEVAGVPAGRLVYFHNHGNPGPGIYLPTGWRANRAEFAERGRTLRSFDELQFLESLPREGFYRVRERFFCCDRQCMSFDEDLLVQLGYNGAAEPIVFTPEWLPEGLALPEQGMKIERDRLSKLGFLKVAFRREMQSAASTVIH
ncbi:MAG: hypothetical protein GX614_12115 [Sandaracinaceae bacterium]|nr:hypothetical protein [Sandaracinaceae bacterium]